MQHQINVKAMHATHLLTPDEVAEYLSVSKTYVYQLLRSKGFPAIRIGKHWRVEPLLLRDWVESRAKEKNLV